MKVNCSCGYVIHDITDNLSYKAHFVSDQDYFNLMDEMDESIEAFETVVNTALNSEGKLDKKDVENLIMRMRSIVGGHTKRLIYQCLNCGRLHIDDHQFRLKSFVPEDQNGTKDLLSSIKKK